MPEISRDDARSKEWQRKFELNRFVRLGGAIYYDTDYRRLHSRIATDNGASLSPSYPFRPLVDDGGEIRIVDGKIFFSGKTSSCDLIGDETEARNQTIELGKAQFGEDIIYPFGA